MTQSRQWVVDMLRRMGYSPEADEAARELPDPVRLEQLMEFGDRHGISRDELVSRMGGSPLPGWWPAPNHLIRVRPAGVGAA